VVIAYALAVLAACGLLWALQRMVAISLGDPPTLLEQYRRVWKVPVIRVRVTK
jgi:hypothetical protein